MYCLKKRFICILFVFVLTAVLAASTASVFAEGIDVGEIEYIDISDEDMNTNRMQMNLFFKQYILYPLSLIHI